MRPTAPARRISLPTERQAPKACAASSTTGIPRPESSFIPSSRGAIWPKICTGRKAFVFVVVASRTLFMSILNVTGSTSTKTGTALRRVIQLTVAKKLYGVVMTSSPSLISSDMSARSSASVPEAHETAETPPRYCSHSFSKRETSGPRMKCCVSNTPFTASRISFLILE